MMDLVNSLFSTCTTAQHKAIKIGCCTAAAGICALGGTLFFTPLNPLLSATYFSAAALISQIAYRVLGAIKDHFSSRALKLAFSAMQLLQIPIWFYLLPSGLLSFSFTGAEKLEIINATAHFSAIPVFFHLAIEAYKDPVITKLAAAAGVLLSLGNGLGRYAKAFRA